MKIMRHFHFSSFFVLLAQTIDIHMESITQECTKNF